MKLGEMVAVFKPITDEPLYIGSRVVLRNPETNDMFVGEVESHSIGGSTNYLRFDTREHGTVVMCYNISKLTR